MAKTNRWSNVTPRIELGFQVPSSLRCLDSTWVSVSGSKSGGKGAETQTSQVSLAESKGSSGKRQAPHAHFSTPKEEAALDATPGLVVITQRLLHCDFSLLLLSLLAIWLVFSSSC